MLRFIFHLEVMLLMSLVSTAQEYNYKHYDSRDGLATSSVYRMLEDKDGFIWFATQFGLSRFDGSHFKNFTTADGLPGNAIIRMFEDSHGRIWMMPFRNAICYYYKGKIYNQQNDPLLRKITLEEFVWNVVENKNGELLLTDTKTIYHIDAQNNVRSIGKEMMKKGVGNGVSVTESGEFNVRFGDKLYATDTRKFLYLRNMPRSTAELEHYILRDKITCWMDVNTLCVESSYYGKLSYRQFIGPVNTMYLLSDSILCLNTTRGTYIYNLLQQKIEQRFLPNGDVSHFLIDKEGGYWFSTQNDGVYRLSSPIFKRIVGTTSEGQKLGVYSLEKLNDDIWAGCDIGHMMKIRNNKAELVPLTVAGQPLGRHIVTAIAVKQNQLAAGCGNYVFVKESDKRFKSALGAGSSKGVAWKSGHELLVASSTGLYEMQVDGSEQDMHSIGRTTSLYYRNDSAWFGSIHGLQLMTPNAGIINLGTSIPLLRVPVIAITGGMDGTIWVATNGSGLIGLQNNRIAWHFDQRNGLNSNLVRCIGIDSGVIWVATDKELNKIPLQPNPVITRYSYSDEMNAEIVNTILVDGNIVYAGTPDGITWFDKRETPGSSISDLKVLGVNVNDKEAELKKNYILPYRNNSIRFDYVAISMKSAGNIVYRYRLNGLDTNWRSTTQTTLDFISLPPGKYRLELFAVNSFNVESSHYSVNIVVQNPFWRSTWFIAGVIALTALIAWFIGTQHNRAVIRKEKMRRLAEQQLSELEQKALRAQMNPHFIFNCLHSIQSFILDNDAEKANKYLSRFANLIRQTLENSLQSFVSLADEIKYLTTYLQLEQLRSESAFEYQIETDSNLSPDTLRVPVMVLQPFVENAVRHGVQDVSGRAGLIKIHFFANDDQLVCQVEDNGIGRQQSTLRKSSASPAYQSRGMQLTYERIELINTNSVKKITVEVVDKFNERQEPVGTNVIVRFPIFTAQDNTLS